jgi:hypothetical protein
MKQISILEAQEITAAAGAAIAGLLKTYGVTVNGKLVPPGPTVRGYVAWNKKLKAVYNPAITWRPDAFLGETQQYALVS